jgi:hypothetical protein
MSLASASAMHFPTASWMEGLRHGHTPILARGFPRSDEIRRGFSAVAMTLAS